MWTDDVAYIEQWLTNVKQHVFQNTGKHIELYWELTDTVTPTQVLEAISEIVGQSIRLIKSQSRQADLVMARKVAVIFFRDKLKMRFKDIATEIGRKDHATAIYYYHKATNELMIGYDDILDLLNKTYNKIYI